VPYALPGEKASVQAESEKPALVRGRIEQLIESSPHRVEPKCPRFGSCGGCQYQHAEDEWQPGAKVEILREVLLRVGKFEPPAGIGLITGPAWEYRNRVQLHFDKGRMGFHAAGSNRVVAGSECPVASPRLNGAMAALARMTRDRRWPAFVKVIELFTNGVEVQVNVLDSGPRHVNRGFFEWCDGLIAGALAPALDYAAAGFVFRVSHKSFFQVNRFLIDKLVEAVAGETGGGRALDLYAGVGLMSLPLAGRFERVAAVEAVGSAAADLEFNARRAGSGIAAVKASAEDFLAVANDRPDLIVVDPPRSGLGPKVVEHLARLAAPRLHIASCDPSTLARDLASLLKSGYRIGSMTLVDLFPQTSHIETVVRLER
jgi:23S rRNA (uracil1939-C5)-methyltransferase